MAKLIFHKHKAPLKNKIYIIKKKYMYLLVLNFILEIGYVSWQILK